MSLHAMFILWAFEEPSFSGKICNQMLFHTSKITMKTLTNYFVTSSQNNRKLAKFEKSRRTHWIQLQNIHKAHFIYNCLMIYGKWHSVNHAHIHIDLSKTFDTMDHRIFICKLKACGVRGTVLSRFWILFE